MTWVTYLHWLAAALIFVLGALVGIVLTLKLSARVSENRTAREFIEGEVGDTLGRLAETLGETSTPESAHPGGPPTPTPEQMEEKRAWQRLQRLMKG